MDSNDTKLKIKTIEIGGIILKDVDALVSSNIEAPLLLGQSALQKLGKFEIDGDSLFITGIVEHPQESKASETKITYSIPPSAPKITMWDKFIAFLGNESKVEELCVKGWNAYQNDMPELGIKYCEEAIKVREKSWKPYALRGQIKYLMVNKNGKNEDGVALDDFSKAVELNTKRRTFYLNELDSISHRYILGEKCWCEAIKGHNDNNSALYDLALRDAQEGIELYPQDEELMGVISFAYTEIRKYELSEKWANKLMEISPRMAHFRLGWLYHHQGKLWEAAKQYELCLAYDSDYSSAEYNLSNVYWDLGYRNRAIELRKSVARKGSIVVQDWLKENGYTW